MTLKENFYICPVVPIGCRTILLHSNLATPALLRLPRTNIPDSQSTNVESGWPIQKRRVIYFQIVGYYTDRLGKQLESCLAKIDLGSSSTCITILYMCCSAGLWKDPCTIPQPPDWYDREITRGLGSVSTCIYVRMSPSSIFPPLPQNRLQWR